MKVRCLNNKLKQSISFTIKFELQKPISNKMGHTAMQLNGTRSKTSSVATR